jgi:TfoX/Sxy family transcriptional regulator of competence genes
MVYDESLAERIRSLVADLAGVTERKMFGGLAFMLKGKVFVGIIGEDLMVRVGPEAHAQALSQPHARPMDFTGRPMKGYVFVGPEGLRSDEELANWIQQAVGFVEDLLKS